MERHTTRPDSCQTPIHIHIEIILVQSLAQGDRGTHLQDITLFNQLTKLLKIYETNTETKS